MATVAYTTTSLETFGDEKRIVLVTWTPLTNTNVDGSPFQNPASADRSIQATGNFAGAATLTCQGSNDGSNWATLTDPQGNAIVFSADGLEQIMEITRYIRPLVSGGNGSTSITVNMVTKRTL